MWHLIQRLNLFRLAIKNAFRYPRAAVSMARLAVRF